MRAFPLLLRLTGRAPAPPASRRARARERLTPNRASPRAPERAPANRSEPEALKWPEKRRPAELTQAAPPDRTLAFGLELPRT